MAMLKVKAAESIVFCTYFAEFFFFFVPVTLITLCVLVVNVIERSFKLGDALALATFSIKSDVPVILRVLRVSGLPREMLSRFIPSR